MLLINAVNAEGRPVELYVKDGKIAAVGQDLAALAGENETVLDAGGLTVLPAFVDLHCHWRTPGFEYKEDIETGSRAAVHRLFDVRYRIACAAGRAGRFEARTPSYSLRYECGTEPLLRQTHA